MVDHNLSIVSMAKGVANFVNEMDDIRGPRGEKPLIRDVVEHFNNMRS